MHVCSIEQKLNSAIPRRGGAQGAGLGLTGSWGSEPNQMTLTRLELPVHGVRLGVLASPPTLPRLGQPRLS